MISFGQYVVWRESSVLEKPDAGDMVADDGPSGSDECLGRLAEMAWHRYQGETRDFFQTLADKDPDIRQALEELDGKGPSQADRVERPVDDDKDVISPPEADTSPGYEDMGG